MGATARRVNWRQVGVGAAVAAIALGAALARLANLNNQPGGLYPDEAAEGMSAHRILHETGYYPTFLPEDAGREALYAYLVSFAFRIFGENVTVLRGTSAVLGILAVLAIGLAIKRLGTAASLLAMLWSAGSLWLIAVSRDGMRNIICVGVGALIVAALFNWYDRPTRRTAVIAGLYAGLGISTYQPLKFTPFLVALWLWMIWRSDRELGRALWRHIKAALVSFFIAATPSLLAAITQPAVYFGRGLATSVLNPDTSGRESFLVHTLRTVGQFLFTGDPNPRHDVAGLPLLAPPVFVLAAIGLGVCWQRRQQGVYLLLLLGSPIYLIVPLIAPEGGSPHFLRNLGLAPFVAAYVGLGSVWVVARFRDWAGKGTSYLVLAGVVVCLGLTGVASAKAYFSRHPADVYRAYSYDLVAMARLVNGGPGDAVILDNYSAIDIEFLDADHPPTIIQPGKRVSHPAAYSVIVARSKHDLQAAVGTGLADRAYVITQFPDGTPAVYAVVP